MYLGVIYISGSDDDEKTFIDEEAVQEEDSILDEYRDRMMRDLPEEN